MSATLLCLSFLLSLLFVALFKPSKYQARGQELKELSCDSFDTVQYPYPVEAIASQFNMTEIDRNNLLTGYNKLVSELNLIQNKGKVIVYDDDTGVLELKKI